MCGWLAVGPGGGWTVRIWRPSGTLVLGRLTSTGSGDGPLDAGIELYAAGARITNNLLRNNRHGLRINEDPAGAAAPEVYNNTFLDQRRQAIVLRNSAARLLGNLVVLSAGCALYAWRGAGASGLHYEGQTLCWIT